MLRSSFLSFFSSHHRVIGAAERMGENDDTSMTTTVVADGTSCSSVVERYFDAWNRRDVTYATSLFADDCVVYDMQYDTAFVGRAAVTKHLTNVGDCLPTHSTSSLMILSVRTLGAVWYGTLGMMVRHCHSPVGVPTTYSTRSRVLYVWVMKYLRRRQRRWGISECSHTSMGTNQYDSSGDSVGCVHVHTIRIRQDIPRRECHGIGTT